MGTLLLLKSNLKGSPLRLLFNSNNVPIFERVEIYDSRSKYFGSFAHELYCAQVYCNRRKILKFLRFAEEGYYGPTNFDCH